MGNPFEPMEPAKKSSTELAFAPEASSANNGEKSETVKAAVTTMNTLDTRVNSGMPMSAVVERDYKKIVQEHENAPQSADDRTIAKAARMRMLQHQMDAGQRDKCVSGLVELMTKYPETKTAKAVHNIASHFDLLKDEKFKKAFEGAPQDAVKRLEDFTKLNAQETIKLKEADDLMDKIAGAGDPAAEAQKYRELIDDNEKNPQSHLGRQIAKHARARLIQSEINNSDDNGDSARNLIVDTLKKYPESSKNRQMIISIFALQASGDTPQNQTLIKAYEDAGGDMSKIGKLNRGR